MLEQKSLDFEVFYCPNPRLNVVMRLTSGLMFLSDYTRQITDVQLANDLLGCILAQSRISHIWFQMTQLQGSFMG